jgi:Ser/Thr protein kinase RdoA (MazF antagonist)
VSRRKVHFSAQELVQVLSHYDVGVIEKARSLRVGSAAAPKMVIDAQKGRFLLKRRQVRKSEVDRVLFAHAVQAHLAAKGFPTVGVVPTVNGAETILELGKYVYEFFEFVEGGRYDGSTEAVAEAGRRLAQLHRCAADFSLTDESLTGSFHDSSTVRRHLRLVPGKAAGENRKLRQTAEELMVLYNASSTRVNELGFDSWPRQVVHGDWHPGNMLFSDRELVAVLDFDLARIAPVVTDLANGMLQFSIVANRPNPVDWPDYLDQAKLVRFLDGYRRVMEPPPEQLKCLPDLMAETIIAEAVLPVVATGFFGNLSGLDFLSMIRRKARWIEKHRDSLVEAIGVSGS